MVVAAALDLLFRIIERLTTREISNVCHHTHARQHSEPMMRLKGMAASNGRIAAPNLVVLKDDKSFFVPCNPFGHRPKGHTGRLPAIADVLAPVSAALTNEIPQSLNAKVDVNGPNPGARAKDWLIQEDFVSE